MSLSSSGCPCQGEGKRGAFIFIIFFASAKESLEPGLLSEACHWAGFTGKQEWQEFMRLLLPESGCPARRGDLTVADILGSFVSVSFIPSA